MPTTRPPHLRDSPARIGGAYQGLGRVTRPSVPDLQRQQRLAASGSHRTEVGNPEAGTPAHPPGQLPVRDPQRPWEGCGTDWATAADDEIGRTVDDGRHNAIKLLGVQAGIGVHHRHD
jgi:hypothetical protein